MPGFLVDLNATVMCLHAPGKAAPVAPNPRVKVDGQPIATQATTYTITGCSFVAGTAPSPCLTAQWTTAAVRVKAGGVPVLLKDSQAVCAPNGTGLNILVTQLRVKGT